MKIKCHHCNRVWEYKGTRDTYASCPNCHFQVHIEKNKIGGESYGNRIRSPVNKEDED